MAAKCLLLTSFDIGQSTIYGTNSLSKHEWLDCGPEVQFYPVVIQKFIDTFRALKPLSGTTLSIEVNGHLLLSAKLVFTTDWVVTIKCGTLERTVVRDEIDQVAEVFGEYLDSGDVDLLIEEARRG